MAYIEPNSVVKVMSGIPIDKDYIHTLYFASLTEQTNYFTSRPGLAFNKVSYQRERRGFIRVEQPTNDLIKCNYLMFQNTSYSDKWFYAFVDSVEYINDNTTQINYTIDVMQTWYFDYKLGEVFVEREHSSTDKVGDSLTPEPLKPGDLIVQSTVKWCLNDAVFNSILPDYKWGLVIGYVPKEKVIVQTDDHESFVTAEITEGGRGSCYNGVYSGANIAVVNYPGDVSYENDVSFKIKVSKLISELIKINATIISLQMVPAVIIERFKQRINQPLPIVELKNFEPINFYKADRSGYYVPKNKKLYTYPYSYLKMTDNTSSSINYTWENFNATVDDRKQATFELTGVLAPSSEILLYPTNYNGVVGKYYEAGLSIKEFVNCTWSESSMEHWFSEKFWNGIISAVISSTASSFTTLGYAAFAGMGGSSTAGASLLNSGGGAGWATLIGVPAATTAMQSFTNIANEALDASTKPEDIQGTSNTSILRRSLDRYGYTMYCMGVEYTRAKTIDNFFTMFGYAVKQLKVPNIFQGASKMRSRWNYIKTTKCLLTYAENQSIPADDESAIQQIYNNGITFWTNSDDVGNYSLDNALPGAGTNETKQL